MKFFCDFISGKIRAELCVNTFPRRQSIFKPSFLRRIFSQRFLLTETDLSSNIDLFEVVLSASSIIRLFRNRSMTIKSENLQGILDMRKKRFFSFLDRKKTRKKRNIRKIERQRKENYRFLFNNRKKWRMDFLNDSNSPENRFSSACRNDFFSFS